MNFSENHYHFDAKRPHGKGRRHTSREHARRGHSHEGHRHEGHGHEGRPVRGEGRLGRPEGFGPRPERGGRRGFAGAEGFGPGQHRKRARRGNIRFAIVSVLADGPENGFGLIKQIEQRTGGTWKPSSGTMYPTLQRLVDEGLIQATAEGNTYELTETGTTFLTENKAEIDAAWQRTEDRAANAHDLREAVGALMQAARQVGATANAEQRERATEVVNNARKALYGILAE